jgi:3D (Asp-Asp-Asp) domain-containing protein
MKSIYSPFLPIGFHSMKRLILSLAIFLLLMPDTFAFQLSLFKRPTREQPKPEQSMLARVTVYWASGGRGSDRFTRLHKCATGMRLREGHCAVDPAKIPYGSRLVFPDGTTLAAVDTGTAVKNRKAARLSGRTAYERNAVVIDRFFETKGQALSWASRNPTFMTVRIVSPNQHAATQVAKQPPPRGIMVVHNSPPASKSQTFAGQAITSNSTIVRNPLTRMGR